MLPNPYFSTYEYSETTIAAFTIGSDTRLDGLSADRTSALGVNQFLNGQVYNRTTRKVASKGGPFRQYNLGDVTAKRVRAFVAITRSNDYLLLNNRRLLGDFHTVNIF